ncbi:MAG: SRPBCC domain-containing protein [Acidimicrobiia bacterium]|nr:SRPBCC domain-containing protein [Acidimicrobiia bacterium]MYC57450.1 SRPBCC domain-containing protein [Acidimicrobiia bacterium]MYI30653.1 SRPBCC domain-containing protein [Acidimicrobiia bacterium]
MPNKRSIELEVEVAGTPEKVWRAVATGPGISSWYVPHTLEERSGGSAIASFGPGPEMQISGRVAVWDPPRRICFDGGEGVDGLAFEWIIKPADENRCKVQLVNTGFGEGEEWDTQYDAMVEGWGLFLSNLRLHLKYFEGQTAVSILPTVMGAGSRDERWAELTTALSIPSAPSIGERIEANSPDTPPLAGTVVEAGLHRIALLLDKPAPGTGFVAVESFGEHTNGASMWLYLYGSDGAEVAERDGPLWQDWLTNSLGTQRTAKSKG